MTIRLEAITKRYPGVLALDRVSIEIREGRIHGIVGENGAGKSTLMGILSGAALPSTGRIVIADTPVVFDRPATAVGHGVAMVSQEGSLVPQLTGAENICLGSEPTSLRGVVDRTRVTEQAETLLARWFPQTALDLRVPVERLDFADQKIVEILRALHGNPKVLILDEPTATLPAREKQSLWVLIRRLAEAGVAVVLISHFLAEILELSDHITVLQDGRTVASMENRDISEGDLVRHMLDRGGAPARPGAERPRARAEAAQAPGAIILEAQAWRGPRFDVDSLALAAGEIVGLVGLTGAGHFDFAQSIFEPRSALGGTLSLNGRDCSRAKVAQMKSRGVAFVPDHRMRNALVPGWSVKENLSLVNVSASTLGDSGILQSRLEKAECRNLVARLGVKTASIDQKIVELSGGNKQKVSIGRWLYAVQRPFSLFVFIEPTEGVDIGAKREIHALIASLAAAGAAILVASSDLAEIAALADRVIPFKNGRNQPALGRQDLDEHHLINAIAGVAA
ncbi:sugar ABC transporter ATP-binding protein [Labrys neptuniae]